MNVPKFFQKEIVKRFGLITLITVGINSFLPLSQWYAVSSFSDQKTALVGLTLTQLLYLPIFLSPFLFLGSLIGLIFKRTRNNSTLTTTVVALALFITGIISINISSNIRHNAFVKLANNSIELIEAIKTYEDQQDAAPESLNELVPNFISSVPHTGIGAYPEYLYTKCTTAEEIKTVCLDNPWKLTVHTSPGGINFDRFVYHPNQNYPEKAYGGTLQRIEDWAYVHE